MPITILKTEGLIKIMCEKCHANDSIYYPPDRSDYAHACVECGHKEILPEYKGYGTFREFKVLNVDDDE